MMIPGMFAGHLHDFLSELRFVDGTGPQGYVNFFWAVMGAGLVTFAVTIRLKIDPAFGKKAG